MALSVSVLRLSTGLLLAASCLLVEETELSPGKSLSAGLGGSRSALTALRRVNAPFFEGSTRFSETAVFWFGGVTPEENSVDVRVGYDVDSLYIRLGIFDRRLWYDPFPSFEAFEDWDAVSLYLDLDGNTSSEPDSSTYRFDAQLVWWEPRDDFQAAYVGADGGWTGADVPFSTDSFWRGTVPNDDLDDRGWAVAYEIPFESLGLGSALLPDSTWGLALAVHDRDDLDGSSIPDQKWPEFMDALEPTMWGQIAFGIPTYSAQPAVSEGLLVVRHDLNGSIVVDGDVGGGTVCGASVAPDYFSAWGGLNYSGETTVNIQNLGDIGDWPCFSRYYLRFPLDSLPLGKVVVSATLTMYQWGNAGEGQDPKPSLIHVSTTDQDWDEASLTWNSAPLARENVASTWAGIFPDWPGEPRKWDVTRAVLEAVEADLPLSLALYESDWDYDSGKYFWSSDAEENLEELRPTLTIAWGRPLADLNVHSQPHVGFTGSPITYTVNVLGSGEQLRLTDTLPSGVSSPIYIEIEGSNLMPSYSSYHHQIEWSDSPAIGQRVTIRCGVYISTADTAVLLNAAELREATGRTVTASASVIANPYLVFQPLVSRRN